MPRCRLTCRKILFGSEPQSEFEQYASWDEVRDALFRGN